MRPHLSCQLRSSQRQLPLNVLEDRSLRDGVQHNLAPRRQVAEALLKLPNQSYAPGPGECPVAQVKPEVSVLLPHEV